MASRRAGGGGGRYYNSTDGDTSDEANLVMNDNESATGRRKKYIVSDSGEDGPSCNPRTFSRNEWICLVVGVVSVLTIIVVFIAVGVSVGTEVRSSSSSSEDPQSPLRYVRTEPMCEYKLITDYSEELFTPWRPSPGFVQLEDVRYTVSNPLALAKTDAENIA